MTPKIIFEEKIAKRIKDRADLSGGSQIIYQFDVTGDEGGQWAIVLNGQDNRVTPGSCENPHCTITISDTDLVRLVQGELKAQLAFMTGRLKVLGLALKLGSILKI